MTETLATSLDAVVCADAREAPLRTSFTRLSWQVPGLLLRPVQSECHEDMHYRVSEPLVKLPRRRVYTRVSGPPAGLAWTHGTSAVTTVPSPAGLVTIT